MKNKSKTPSSERKPGKKPYTAPKVTRLGSVREFTQSGTGGFSDGGMFMAAPSMMMCIGPLATIDEHRYLLADGGPQALFRKVIFEKVRKGDVVLDLGTGSGLHAFFACQAGAKRVYAIESGTVIELAKAAARDNGFADRIHFIYGDSREVELPEKVDVIITNVGFIGCLESLPDASKRFLKRGGRLIPGSAELNFAPVEATRYYDEVVNAWSKPYFGLRFDAFRGVADSFAHTSHFKAADFLCSFETMADIDFSKPLPGGFTKRLEFTAERSGTMTGLAGWYEFRLSEKDAFSTRPPLEYSDKLWYQPFLPLREPVKVKRGSRIVAEMGFYPAATLHGAVWNWTVDVDGRRFEQSSFDSVPLSTELLGKLSH